MYMWKIIYLALEDALDAVCVRNQICEPAEVVKPERWYTAGYTYTGRS